MPFFIYPDNKEKFDSLETVIAFNKRSRAHSEQEKQFTKMSTAGMLQLWEPCKDQSQDSIHEEKISDSPKTQGLPPEVGSLVGEWLSRRDAARVAQTCTQSNLFAKKARDDYVNKNGKTYEEKVYFPYTFNFRLK